MSQIELLLRNLDQAYDKKAWHGPNLKGSFRGLTVAQAVWRPRPDRHCIAEIVMHAAYWKYAVRRRLRGDKRGSFAFKGSNWFELPDLFAEEMWRQCAKVLDEEHRILRAAVAAMSDLDLPKKAVGSKLSNEFLITGIAAHDVYHAGQIQLLKRMQ